MKIQLEDSLIEDKFGFIFTESMAVGTSLLKRIAIDVVITLVVLVGSIILIGPLGLVAPIPIWFLLKAITKSSLKRKADRLNNDYNIIATQVSLRYDLSKAEVDSQVEKYIDKKYKTCSCK